MLLAAAVIAAASCSKVESAQSEIAQTGIVLHATVNQATATRATLSDGDTWTFAFSQGDRVFVQNEDNPYKQYIFTKGDGDFTCPSAEKTKTPVDWYAYFPQVFLYFNQQSGKKEDVANLYALSGTTASPTTGEKGLSIAMAPQVAILVIDNQKGPIDINVKTGPNSWVSHLLAKNGSAGFDLVTAETKVSLLTADTPGLYYIAVPACVQLCIKDGDTEIKSTITDGFTAGKYYELAIAKPTFTVTFDANGHGIAPESLSEVPYGSTITKPDDLTAGGYDFSGWYKDEGCTTLWNFEADIVTENITIYAGWHAWPIWALPGKFTVSEGKQVSFSRGNLTATIDATGAPTAWRFAANQYDFLVEGGANKTIGTAAGDIDLFGWSTSDMTYGISTSTKSLDYSGDFVDWGTAIDNKGTWRALTVDEWMCLFNTRDASTVNGMINARYAKATVKGNNGIILLPDIYDHPSGIAELKNINTENAEYMDNSYDLSAWQAIESAGAVFLPAAGRRNGYNVYDVGEYGTYWSSSRDTEEIQYDIIVFYALFRQRLVDAEKRGMCCFGYSVRLVTDCE